MASLALVFTCVCKQSIQGFHWDKHDCRDDVAHSHCLINQFGDPVIYQCLGIHVEENNQRENMWHDIEQEQDALDDLRMDWGTTAQDETDAWNAANLSDDEAAFTATYANGKSETVDRKCDDDDDDDVQGEDEWKYPPGSFVEGTYVPPQPRLPFNYTYPPDEGTFVVNNPEDVFCLNLQSEIQNALMLKTKAAHHSVKMFA